VCSGCATQQFITLWMCAAHIRRRCGARQQLPEQARPSYFPVLILHVQRKRSITKHVSSHSWSSSRPLDCAHRGISVAFLVTRLSLPSLSFTHCRSTFRAHRTMTLSLCEVCHTIFAEPSILNTEEPHHERPDDFVKAATYCYICRAITKSDLWREV
jgi:hypothetical protein